VKKYQREDNSYSAAALPRDPWTVLNRVKTGVVLDGSVETGANVYFEALLSKTLK